MEKTDVTSKLVKYMLENNIVAERVSKDTNIPAEKLNGNKKLSAAELLVLCSYLNVKPEQFRQDMKND